MTPRASLGVALAVVVALVAGSSPRAPGDGSEYVSVALNVLATGRPWISAERIAPVEARIQEDLGRDPGWIERDGLRTADRSRDFVHFWLYPLLAVPGVALTEAVGLHPAYGFTLLNVLLLVLALRAALPRLGGAASVLLFAGPVIWWIDKPHPEVFTFSLLMVAVLFADESPWWSMLAFGGAAAQNPPAAAGAGLVWLLHFVSRSRHLADRRFWLGTLGALGLCLLHPAYYLLRHGTPSPLFAAGRPGMPDWAELVAPVADPAIGLLAHFPVFAIAIVAALLVSLRGNARRLLSRDVLVGVGLAAVFLFAFGRALNVHSGGTPGMSRYGLWLVPLAAPLLRAAKESNGKAVRVLMWQMAAVSAAICAFAFHPDVGQFSREPSPLARYLWARHPHWNNPLPEIFAEIALGIEGAPLPAANPGCEKVLLSAAPDGETTWPLPCYPERVPQECRAPGATSYANLVCGRYRFAPAPGRQGPLPVNPGAAWTAGTEARVRAAFIEAGWPQLRLYRRNVIRAVYGVERAWSWEGTSRSLLVVVRPRAEARLTVRFTEPVEGRIVAADSGETLREIGAVPAGRWDLPIPAGHDMVLVLLTRFGGRE